MADTIWVLKEGREKAGQEDDLDHTLILRHEESLKLLSTELGVKSLSDFFDYSILDEEFGILDTEPNYSKPAEIRLTLEVLIAEITNNELLTELKDCLTKVKEAEQEKSNVRLAIIP